MVVRQLGCAAVPVYQAPFVWLELNSLTSRNSLALSKQIVNYVLFVDAFIHNQALMA